MGNPGSSTSDFLPFESGQSAPLHLSRQMTIFTSETLSVYQKRLNTNRGNGYLQPFAIGNPFSSTQGEIFPSHDCDNTSSFNATGSVTGGLGSGQVTRSPASTPPAEESGQFPASSVVAPVAPNYVGPAPLPPLSPGPYDSANPSNNGPSAFAPCTIAPNFPSLFGGGKVPEVLPDQ